MRKKGYFFTMDALLALLLFTTVILLIHLFYINAPPLSQLHYLSRDTLDTLSTTKIKDLDETAYPFLIDAQFSDINEELTVIEQLATYNAGGQISKKEEIERQLLQHLYPAQYKYTIEFGEARDARTSKVIVVSRKLVGSVQVR